MRLRESGQFLRSDGKFGCDRRFPKFIEAIYSPIGKFRPNVRRGVIMLGLGAAKPVTGQAEDVVNCQITKAFEFVAYQFFDNYPRWCPQVVDLEPLSSLPVGVGCKGRQVTRDRGIDSESTFEVTQFEDPRKLEIKGSTEPFRSS